MRGRHGSWKVFGGAAVVFTLAEIASGFVHGCNEDVAEPDEQQGACLCKASLNLQMLCPTDSDASGAARTCPNMNYAVSFSGYPSATATCEQVDGLSADVMKAVSPSFGVPFDAPSGMTVPDAQPIGLAGNPDVVLSDCAEP